MIVGSEIKEGMTVRIDAKKSELSIKAG